MVSRRDFLQIGVAATGVALVPSAVRAAGTEEPTLPPAIAALKSRAAEATPISGEERQQRLENARRLMQQNKLDAMLLIGGTSLVYFSGIHWWNSERLFAMVQPAVGEAFFVCPAFEHDRAMEQIHGPNSPFGRNVDLLLWQEDESPYQQVARGLAERKIGGGRLGMEETVKFVFSDEVGKAAPALQIVSATPVTAGCRMIKSRHELDLMQLANEVTLAAYQAAYRSLKEGMTQHDFGRLVAAAHQQQGFAGDASVQVGENSALPHGSAKPQVIREGAILLIDGGCEVEGYNSDISRTFVLGKATDKMKKVFDIEHRAQSAALAAARPGAACESVDAAARKVIEDAGYGPDYKYFTHRVGHGIGMDGHEWPYLVRGNKLLMKPGMCFSDEPGIYIRGEFGIRLEDDMHITEDGARLFTPQSPSLEEPFGKA